MLETNICLWYFHVSWRHFRLGIATHAASLRSVRPRDSQPGPPGAAFISFLRPKKRSPGGKRASSTNLNQSGYLWIDLLHSFAAFATVHLLFWGNTLVGFTPKAGLRLKLLIQAEEQTWHPSHTKAESNMGKPWILTFFSFTKGTQRDNDVLQQLPGYLFCAPPRQSWAWWRSNLVCTCLHGALETNDFSRSDVAAGPHGLSINGQHAWPKSVQVSRRKEKSLAGLKRP